MSKISFSLDADQEAFVNERIAEGHYSDASDYLRELVRRDQVRRDTAGELRDMLEHFPKSVTHFSDLKVR
jgi:putative addiction module CopG family antidote